MSHRNLRLTGSCYEEVAAAFLVQKGYEILERNFRCRQGEIDLVARHGRYLVFVEVKYRSSRRAGEPEEAVDCRKQDRIRNAARYYLYSHHMTEEEPCRFDVVAIARDEVRVIADAF